MSSETFGEITLERILARENLLEALKKVEANKGSCGVDGMETSELRSYFKSNPGKLTRQILQGRFQASPIRRVYIPKDNGEQRPLGIPTVIDRFVQQAIALVLSEEYEKIFVDHSYGFRPNRDCRQAVRRAMEHIREGYEWVIDIDLRKFFDTVNHDYLVQLLSRRIRDGRVISLIHKFLRAPISEEGKVGKANQVGCPQGGVISPVCANVVLHELDVKLREKKMRACRYADDAVIFCKSKKAAERALAWIKRFIETKLHLKVNEEKTKILKVGSPDVQFLGFSFTSSVSKSKKLKFPQYRYFPVVHAKKRKKLKDSLRMLLDRRAPGGVDKVKRELKLKLRGWANYFKKAVPLGWIRLMDAWIRRRIRQLLWKQWKTPENRFRELRARRDKTPALKQFAYSCNRYWHHVVSKPIHMALNNRVLEAEGWYSLEKALRTASRT